MPVIRGETRRGTRLWPGLVADQARWLLVTAAVVWGEWHLTWPPTGRVALMLPTAVAGAAYALVRWPPGPQGERISAWLPRWWRFVLRPRAIAGRAVPGWDGVRAVRPDGVIRIPAGWAMVLECQGDGETVGGDGVQRAWRQILHGVEGPFQLVSESRWPASAERPPRWDPAAAPEGLRQIATAYGQHWQRLVEERRAVVRRSFLVLTAAATPDAAARLTAQGAVATAAAAGLGVRLRALGGPEVVEVLRTAAGAAEGAGPLTAPGVWVVRHGA